MYINTSSTCILITNKPFTGSIWKFGILYHISFLLLPFLLSCLFSTKANPVFCVLLYYLRVTNTNIVLKPTHIQIYINVFVFCLSSMSLNPSSVVSSILIIHPLKGILHLLCFLFPAFKFCYNFSLFWTNLLMLHVI